MSESRTGGPLDATRGPLDAALQRLGNAVACVSSRDYPHVVADGTMALREVELGVEALRTALHQAREAIRAAEEWAAGYPLGADMDRRVADRVLDESRAARIAVDAVVGAPERDR